MPPCRCTARAGLPGYDAGMRWPPLLICMKLFAVPLGAAGAADGWLIDDRRSGAATSTLGPDWRFFTDGVMGGVSSGAMTVETVAGRGALCLRGQVRLDNNGGFVQMALELPDPPPPGDWRGVEIDVLGNGRRYGVHLRNAGMWLPWQSWRAPFQAAPAWQRVQLPFTAFEPYRTSGKLVAQELRRIGIVAIGEAFEAEVCVARLALYR